MQLPIPSSFFCSTKSNWLFFSFMVYMMWYICCIKHVQNCSGFYNVKSLSQWRQKPQNDFESESFQTITVKLSWAVHRGFRSIAQNSVIPSCWTLHCIIYNLGEITRWFFHFLSDADDRACVLMRAQACFAVCL